MNKKIIALATALLMLFLVGCNKTNNQNQQGGGENNTNIENESGNGNTSVEEKNENGEFVFKGKVTSTNSKKHIEMEIIDSDIAFGTYWVIVGEETEFLNADGNRISREDIGTGDTIEVVFGGQVMNSYPPQISAIKVIKL